MVGFLNSIKSGKVLCSAGCVDTVLARDYPGQVGSFPRISLDHADILEEIAGTFFEAGADILTSYTCDMSPLKLTPYSLDDRTIRINKSAVRATRAAIGNRAYLAGMCGPSGKVLRPYGSATPEEIMSNFRIQMKAFVDENVDCIILYAFEDLIEVSLAIVTAKQVAGSIPILAAMKYYSYPSGFFTLTGTEISNATHSLEDAGADIVGAACSFRVETMIEVARKIRENTSLPIAVFPDAGGVEKNHTVSKPEFDDSPHYFASRIESFIEVGVSIIGGCCGTTPEHILAVSHAIRSYKKKDPRDKPGVLNL
jgi:5-methyltetrahydrofolate--homocysteine methyltransferase